MVVSIITVAGISSRFNQGLDEKDKALKCIYYEKDYNATLLKHLLDLCCFADKIIIVGGYKYSELCQYCAKLPEPLLTKIDFVYNKYFADLGSGYSLYLGLEKTFSFKSDISQVLFVEGDLDVDAVSFDRVIGTRLNVLTYTSEPIYTNKSVVLFKDQDECYKYAFNSKHGLLKIEEYFSCIFNSGQIWKFTNIAKLKVAAAQFIEKSKDETNLALIQNYIDLCAKNDFELIRINRWTNCNTREDYKKITNYWEAEK